MATARFATAISCIDGRIQLRVLDQIELRFGARNIDNITSPGAVQHLAGEVSEAGRHLLKAAETSIAAHDSTQIAVIAHSDCAANQVPDATQKQQLVAAQETLAGAFPEAEVLALFLDLKTGFARV